MAPINPRRTRAAAFKTERPVAAPMKAFRVTGIAPFGQQRQAFSMDLPATDAADAEHRVYSIMGSRHNVTRRSIDLQSVTEIDPHFAGARRTPPLPRGHRRSRRPSRSYGRRMTVAAFIKGGRPRLVGVV